VLLLLALLLPRACQALMGSDSDAGRGPSGEQQAGAAGTETGTGAGEGESEDNAGTEDASPGDAEKDEGADEAKDETSDRGAPFLEDGSDGENDSGGDEAAPDLLALVTPTTTVAEEEVSAGEEGGSVGGSSGAVEPQADEQPISENQFALAASPAPAKQPSSGGERAPTRRSEPAETAPVVEQDAASRSERVRARADRLAATPVAEPAALQGSGHGQAVVEPAATETFGTTPVAPAPAPVPAASISSGPDFAPTQVGAVRGAGAVPAALPAVPAALPAGPRLGGAGPTGTPGPAF
jgi:hypothetical protein